MSKQVVLKSFAELALALHLEELPDEPKGAHVSAELAPDEQGPTVDADHLLAELEAACADLHKAAQQDETARAVALRDLERYEARSASLRQAEAARERAAHVQSEAAALVANAFTPEARLAASRVADAAQQAGAAAACLARQHQREIDQLASRLDLERLLAERRRQAEVERARAAEVARQRRADEVIMEARQAIEGGRLDVAQDILVRAAEEGLDSPDLTALHTQVAQRLLVERTMAAEQALWSARRIYRHDPAAAVAALERLVVDDLPDPLARQVFGAWARACLRLCRERAIQAPLRYAPHPGRGVILAPDGVEGAYVVVSTLGMGAEWSVGRRVGKDVARQARPLV